MQFIYIKNCDSARLKGLPGPSAAFTALSAKEPPLSRWHQRQ
jgi:hypothetical protein